MTTFDRIYETARTNRLYRDPDNGWLCGVCAGLARWMGVKTWAVRLAMVLMLMIAPVMTALGYVLATLVLNRRPESRWSDFERRFGATGRNRFADRSW